MTPTEQPAEPQLTRRQLREIRMTGATSIVTPEAAAESARASAEAAHSSADEPGPEHDSAQNDDRGEAPTATAPGHEFPAEEVPADEPVTAGRASADEAGRASADEVVAHEVSADEVGADEANPDEESPPAPASPTNGAVGLGGHARTRKQAREQERIRTASIPVLSPVSPPEMSDDDDSADGEDLPHGDSVWAPQPAKSPTWMGPPGIAAIMDGASFDDGAPADEVRIDDAGGAVVTQDGSETGEPADDSSPDDAPTEDAVAERASSEDASSEDGDASSEDEDAWSEDEGDAWSAPVAAAPADESVSDISADAATPVLRSNFGSGLFEAREESFDDLIARGSSAGASTGSTNALILSDMRTALPPLTSPVTSTGQIILTGTFALPEGLGSQGHAPGVDGKEVDAVLLDGELTAHSSPTPIAATAAVSQAKTAVEMIRPPTPEKSNKLVIILAITAGVLSIGAIGFIIYAITTGKF